jgi:hypothetical protein
MSAFTGVIWSPGEYSAAAWFDGKERDGMPDATIEEHRPIVAGSLAAPTIGSDEYANVERRATELWTVRSPRQKRRRTPSTRDNEVVVADPSIAGRRLPGARDVPTAERLPVADLLDATLRALPDSGLPQDRALRRDVRRVVRSLRRAASEKR